MLKFFSNFVEYSSLRPQKPHSIHSCLNLRRRPKGLSPLHTREKWSILKPCIFRNRNDRKVRLTPMHLLSRVVLLSEATVFRHKAATYETCGKIVTLFEMTLYSDWLNIKTLSCHESFLWRFYEMRLCVTDSSSVGLLTCLKFSTTPQDSLKTFKTLSDLIKTFQHSLRFFKNWVNPLKARLKLAKTFQDSPVLAYDSL